MLLLKPLKFTLYPFFKLGRDVIKTLEMCFVEVLYNNSGLQTINKIDYYSLPRPRAVSTVILDIHQSIFHRVW